MNKFKKVLPTILSVVSVVGLAVTVVTAVRVTPKAVRILDDRKTEKGSDLTVKETVKSVWKCYIPTLTIGIGTAACIIGANVLNKRAQASLASAYALVSNAYGKYKGKVVELYGKDTHDKIISSIAAEKSNAAPIYAGSFIKSLCLDFGEDEEELLFYDTFSGRYFTSTVSKVLQAEYHLNRNYVLGGEVSANDFYDFLGIGRVDGGNEIGWSLYNVDGEIMWIDFDHKKTVTDDGLEVHIIDTVFEPGQLYSDEILSRNDNYYLANISSEVDKIRKITDKILECVEG